MTRNKTNYLPFVLIGIAAIAAIVLGVVLNKDKEPTLFDRVPQTEHELLYNDVLSKPFVSSEVTVLGISVGMTTEDVANKLGIPDVVDKAEFGRVQNWRYGTHIGLNETGVVYHIEDDIVTRIAVGPPMNQYLQGHSRVGKSKEEMYSLYGQPERLYDIPRGRFFVYNKMGFEEYIGMHGEFQYAFVYPNRKLPTMAYTTQNKTNLEIVKTELPTLLTDTTTLCNQGPTFGQNTVSKECKRFDNSCVIPDHWVEVDTCSEGNQVNSTQ